MAITQAAIDIIYSLLTDKWLCTADIMVNSPYGREHTVTVLGHLFKNGTARKKKQPHAYDTCNKADNLWRLKADK
jgi:hypothetical protein